MNLLSQFKNYLFSQDKKASNVTVKNYLSDINHFLRWFEQTYAKTFEPQDITKDVITNYKAQSSDVFSASSMERHLSTLRKFFKFLQIEGLISLNPFELTVSAEAPAKEDPWRIKDFKNYLYVYSASRLTIKNYLIDIKQFLAWAQSFLDLNTSNGNLSLDFVDSELIEDYKQNLLTQGNFSPATINRKLSSLRKYLSWAQSEGLINNLDFKVKNAQLQKPVELYVPDVKKVQEANKDNQPISIYSSFPPLRLAQKTSEIFTFTLDSLIINPLAQFVGKAEYALWKVKGQPVFTRAKSIRLPKGLNSASILNIKNLPKVSYAPSEISTKYFPLPKKILFALRYSRPKWYKAYHSYPITHYFHFAVLIIFLMAIAFGFNNAFFQKASQSPTLAAGPTAPPHILSFQGRLTDNNDNPITSDTALRFAIYDNSTASGSALLWEEVNSVLPDQDGIFNTLLGNNTPIPPEIFANNSALWLGVTVESTDELQPRQPLATVAFATNSEFLQGMAPTTQAGLTAYTNTVLALDGTVSSPTLTIGGTVGTTFQATGGQFTLSGKTLLLTTAAGTNTNIELAPDGLGMIDLQKPVFNSTNNNNINTATGAVEVDDLLAVLATSSGQSAFTINQNGTGPLISASTSGTAKFTINNYGDLYAAGAATISGNLSVAGTGNFSGNLATGGNLVLSNNAGTTTFGGIAYTWPTSISQNGYILSTQTNGTLNWIAANTTSTNFWQELNGALSPTRTADDLLLGSSSTASAAFAFTGLMGNQTQASFSGNLIVMPNNGFGGNVGIGTTNPQAKLHLVDSSDVELRMTAGNSWPLILKQDVSSNFSINNDNNVRFYIQAGGNVGIGTTTPNAKLSIQGTNDFATLGTELVTNGDFVTCPGAWTLGTNWSCSGGAHHTSGFAGDLSQSITLTPGATYQVSFEVSGMSQGSVTPVLGGTSGQTIWGNSTSQVQIIIPSSTGSIVFSADADFNGTISYVSVTKVTTADPLATILNSDGTTAIEIRSGGTGNNNTYIGLGTGRVDQGGQANTGVGFSSLYSNEWGIENSAYGEWALTSNTTGNGNSAFGVAALYSNTTGEHSDAFGGGALELNTTGNYNVAFGDWALNQNAAGSYNTAIGDHAGFNALGSGNVFLGAEAGFNETGSNKLYIANNDTTTLIYGDFSTGEVTLPHYATCTLKTDGSGLIGCGTDLSSGASFWKELSGALSPIQLGDDLLLGGSTTASAAFAFTGLMNNTPTGNHQTQASFSGNLIVMPNNGFGGKVGIGTTNPTAKLAVSNQTSITSAELVTDGDFALDPATNNWSLGSCATWSSGAVTILYDGSCDANISTTFSSTAGKTYLLSFDLTTNGDSMYYYFDNNVQSHDEGPFGTGHHTIAFKTSFSGLETIWFESWNWMDSTGWTIDNVSIHEINDIAPAIAVKGYDGSIWLSLGADILGNTALGKSSFASNTDGYYNSAFGTNALYSNTTGDTNSAVGSYALSQNTTGHENTAMGSNALELNISGWANTAVGQRALSENTTGLMNSAFGSEALVSNTTGGGNTAVGAGALGYNTTGQSNSAFGDFALNSNLIGHQNVALGTNAGFNALGGGNVFLGYEAGYNETGSNKLYIANNDTTTLIYGDFSTGEVTLPHYATCTLKTDGSGLIGCGTDLSSGASFWQELSGALSPIQLGDDLLLGGSTTASAAFAFTGLMNNTPTGNHQTQASFSGNLIVMPNNGFGGKVGIGTTNPTAKLDIAGSASLSGNLSFNGLGTNNVNLLNGSNLNFVASAPTAELTYATDIGSFSTSGQGQLPETLGGHTMVTASVSGTSYVYVLGGDSGSGGGNQTAVYKATIDGSGNIGTLSTAGQGQLPQALVEHSAVIFNVGGTNYIYVLGGYKDIGSQSTVYKATIDGSGNIGTFSTSGQGQLPQAMYAQSAVTANISGTNYIYVMGGYGSVSDQVIYRATIDGSGNIGTFSSSGQSQYPSTLGLAVEASVNGGNYIYVVGGCSECDTSSTVYKATIDSSGNVGSFSVVDQGQLPQALTDQTVTLANIGGTNYVYILGGYNSSWNYAPTVYKATIDNNGDLGIFSTDNQSQLPQGIEWHATAIANVSSSNYIYVSGGYTNEGMQSTVYKASLIGNTPATTTALSINNNGNVGIGLTDPTEKLAVNGNIALTDAISLTQTEEVTNGNFSSAPYGSEEITNGTFTGSATGWNLNGGWSYSSGHVSYSGSGGDELSQTGTLTDSAYYDVSLSVGGTAGSVDVCLGENGGCNTILAGAGTVQFTNQWYTSTNKIVITPSGTFNGTIDNVSMKKAGWALGSGWTYSGSNLSFTPPTGPIQNYDLTNLGSGYTVGDTLTANGGGNDAHFNVDSIIPYAYKDKNLGPGNTGGYIWGSLSGSDPYAGISQSFTAASSYNLNYVDLKLYKANTPTDGLQIEITTTSPEGTVLGTSDELLASSIASSAWNRFTFSSPVSITSGNTYYITVYRTGSYDTSNWYMTYYSPDSTYTGGTEYYKYNGSWSNYGGDLLFGTLESTTPGTTGPIDSLSLSSSGTGYSNNATYNLTGGTGSSAQIKAYLGYTTELILPGTLAGNSSYNVSLNLGGTTGTVDVCLGDYNCNTFNAGSGAVSFNNTTPTSAPSVILALYPSDDFNGTIDDISVKQVLNPTRTIAVSGATSAGVNGTDLTISAGASQDQTGGNLILSGGGGDSNGLVKIMGYSTTTPVAVFEPNGNVGIGTNTPAFKLDVSGTVNASEYCINGSDCVTSWAGGSGPWATSGTDIYNTNSGNVGIGTSTPQTNLDITSVSGVASQQLYSEDSSGYSDLTIINDANVAINLQSFGSGWIPSYESTGIPYANLSLLISNSTNFLIGTTENSPLEFMTNKTERLRITENGSVGIGTINPQAALDVVAPDTAAADLSQLSTNAGSGGTDTGDVYGQSFTPTVNSTGLQVDFLTSTDFNGHTSHLYSGDGNGGTLLATGTWTSLGSGWYRTVFHGVTISSGSQYTVYLTSSGGSSGISDDTTNPYPGGQEWYGVSAQTGRDMAFKTYALTTPSIAAIFENGNVGIGTNEPNAALHAVAPAYSTKPDISQLSFSTSFSESFSTPGDMYGQSFTPTLSSVGLQVDFCGDSGFNGKTSNLYSGEGDGGALLATGTWTDLSTRCGSTGHTWHRTTFYGVTITGGSQYSVYAYGNGNLGVSADNDVYAGGNLLNPTAFLYDMAFRTYALIPGLAAIFEGGNVGIGTVTPLVTLDVRGSSGTLAVASASGRTSFAALVANNDGVGDLFTASASGWARFTVSNAGAIGLSGTNGNPTYGSAGNCLITGGSAGVAASWGACGSGGANYWNLVSGIGISNGGYFTPINSTADLLIGGQATSSAAFAVLGLSLPNHQTTASVSGNFIVMPNNGYGGNVGVGTTTPDELLHIAKNADTYIKVQATAGTGQIAGLKLQRGAWSTDNFDDWNIYNSNGRLYFDSLETIKGTNTRLMLNDQTGSVEIGTTITNPQAILAVRGNSGTQAVASFSGQTSFATLVTNNDGVGDLFTASASGWARFTVSNAGGIRLVSGYGSAGNCLITGGSAGVAASWGACGSGGANYWNLVSGIGISNGGYFTPINSTADLLIGGQATSSAAFAVLGLSLPNHQTTASVSGNFIVMPNNGYGGRVGIGTTNPTYNLDVAGTINGWNLLGNNLLLGTSSASLATAFKGFNGYTNFSGGIGTGGVDSILGAQRLTSQGNLINIGSYQGGEMLLTKAGSSFAAYQTYSDAGNATYVAAADLNGDGKSDVVVPNMGANVISVFLNNGNGTFPATGTTYATGTYPEGIAIGDLNGDGKADLAVTNANSDTVSIFINNGNGTFAAKQDYTTGTSPKGIATADLNGDGKLDLAIADSNPTFRVSVLINKGDGTFAAKQDYVTGSTPNSVAIGDVNGDGKADLAVTNSASSTVSIFINNGNGTFAAKQDYTTGTSPMGIATADLNGDGKLDVVTGNNTNISVFLNLGNGTFPATGTTYTVGTNPIAVTTGDINGDGKPDIVIGDAGSINVFTLINNGDGTFPSPQSYTAYQQQYGVALADLNGDGKSDIVSAAGLYSYISVLINQTTPMFYAQASTGNIGIGTITPNAKLSIQGENDLATLGTEKITATADQDFSSNLGHWTTTGSPPWKINIASSDVAEKNAPGEGALTLPNTYLNSAPVAGKTYQITFDFTTTASSSGSLTPSFGGIDGVAIGQDVNMFESSQEQVVLATNTNVLTFTPTADWYGTIDNVSVKEITPVNPLATFLNSDGTTAIEIRSGGTGSLSTFIGYQAGAVNQAGAESVNTGIGYGALMSNTTGGGNTALGAFALTSNTTGYDNNAFGAAALMLNTTGHFNNAFGIWALGSNTTGSRNNAFGEETLSSNTSGDNNNAFGNETLSTNTTGLNNSAFGHVTLVSNTTGSYNSAFGNQALYSNTTGNNNTAVGVSAGQQNSLGDGNVFLGYMAGYNETGSNKLYIDTSGGGTPLIYGEFDNGSVGINTNSITSGFNLEVAGTTRGWGFTGTGGGDGFISFTAQSPNNGYTALASYTGSDTYPNVKIPGWSAIGFGPGSSDLDVWLHRSGTNAITIDSNASGGTAYLGIGNTTPLAALDVTGSASLSANLYFTGVTTGPNINILNGKDLSFATSPGGNSGASFTTKMVFTNQGSIKAYNFVDMQDNTYYLDPAASGATYSLKTAGAINIGDNGGGTPLSIQTSGGIIVGAAGAGKLTATTLDPLYTIDGTRYATYAPSMTGVKEEVTGKATLTYDALSQAYSYTLGLNNQPVGSDVWLFSRVVDTDINLTEALLTPDSSAQVWYQKDPSTRSITFYASQSTSVSFRLTAPRFDHDQWGNLSDETAPGITGLIAPSAQGNTLPGSSPSAELGGSFDFTIVKLFDQNGNETYALTDSLNNIVKITQSFSDLLVANIQAGLIQAQKVTANSLSIATENVTIAGQSLRNYIVSIVSDTISNSQFLISNGQTIISPLASIDNLKTGFISPLAQNPAIALKLDSNKLSILNGDSASSSAVAIIDNQGNASFSGQLTSNSLNTGDATISGTLHAGKILADDIVGLRVQAATVSAQYITNIYNSTSSGGTDFGLIANSGTLATGSSLFNNFQDNGNYISIASYSSQFAYVADLSAANAAFSQNLMVFGSTSLSDTSVVGQLSIDGSLILANNSVNVLGSDLNLQPLRQGGISLMGGLVYFDTDGNLKLNGNAEFAKDVTVKGNLAAGVISPLPGNDLKVNLGDNNSSLVVHGASNSAVLSVNPLGDLVASGTATIAKLNLSLVQPAFAVSPTEFVATGSAGTAQITPYQTEVTIDNALVTEKSLIYITPTSSTNNQVLYLLRQMPTAEDGIQGSFTVGLQNPSIAPIPFNWIIIN